MPIEPMPIELDGTTSQPMVDGSSTIRVPAQLRFLQVLRLAIRAYLADSEADAGCACDVDLAVDELAAILILSAATPSEIRLDVGHDDEDVYVRMSVPIGPRDFAPPYPELTRTLLDATADSYDVRLESGDLVAVVQRSLDSR